MLCQHHQNYYHNHHLYFSARDSFSDPLNMVICMVLLSTYPCCKFRFNPLFSLSDPFSCKYTCSVASHNITLSLFSFLPFLVIPIFLVCKYNHMLIIMETFFVISDPYFYSYLASLHSSLDKKDVLFVYQGVCRTRISLCCLPSPSTWPMLVGLPGSCDSKIQDMAKIPVWHFSSTSTFIIVKYLSYSPSYLSLPTNISDYWIKLGHRELWDKLDKKFQFSIHSKTKEEGKYLLLFLSRNNSVRIFIVIVILLNWKNKRHCSIL